MSLKNPVRPSGIDPGTLRLIAQHLNHYATPGPMQGMNNMKENSGVYRLFFLLIIRPIPKKYTNEETIHLQYWSEIPDFTYMYYVKYVSYTECPRRIVPDFGRVFLMLKYTDITQNTYVQS
jgi:hypothetical protein